MYRLALFLGIIALSACEKDDEETRKIPKAVSFTQKSNGFCDLWYVAADKSNLGQVVNDNLYTCENDPAWSADGRSLFFIKKTNQKGINGIYTIKPNGKDYKPVYTDKIDQQRNFFQLTSSTDNEHIVFSLEIARTGRKVIEVYSMCPCGDRVRRLTQFETTTGTPVSTESYGGSFSKDNKYLYLVTSDPAISGLKTVNIYKMSIDSGTTNLLRSLKAIDVLGCVPSISSDGRKILLSIDGNIFSMNEDGSVLQPVFNLKGYHPKWDIDNKTFYFSSFNVSDMQPGIYRSNINFTEVTRLTRSITIQYGGLAINRK